MQRLSYLILGLILGLFFSIFYTQDLSVEIRKQEDNTTIFDTTSTKKSPEKPTEIQQKTNTKITLAFGGDIMLSRGVGARNKTEGYDRIFKNFHPNAHLSDETILFYNLESPFTKKTDNDIDYKTFIFKTNEKSIEVLNELKGNKNMVLSLANNHIRNGGGEGIDATIAILKENAITPVGVQKTTRPSFASLTKQGKKICFGAYTYDGGTSHMRDALGVLQKYEINPIKKQDILGDITQMKLEKCDLKVVSLHWGYEYIFNPQPSQENLAHALVDAGADLIIGGHSHILGKQETYKGKHIYYSLGNYIFDQNWGSSASGKQFDYIYDEKLKKNTVPTYIGNTFVHEYEFQEDGTVKLTDTKNIKHRIDYGAVSEY